MPHRHLANAVKYILDEKNNEAKTCDGLYVGGNAGYNSEDIIKTFLDTKELYGKLHGRQGYHFVISFEPGETDADEAYKITKEFAKKYLGENYDYVFATHIDKNHIHSHLIFNSVSRTDGYKYRYENGDWERHIQPVTDEICMEHGLKPLKFEENKKKGLSYAEWNEKKNGRMNWTHVIRADIDLALKVYGLQPQTDKYDTKKPSIEHTMDYLVEYLADEYAADIAQEKYSSENSPLSELDEEKYKMDEYRRNVRFFFRYGLNRMIKERMGLSTGGFPDYDMSFIKDMSESDFCELSSRMTDAAQQALREVGIAVLTYDRVHGIDRDPSVDYNALKRKSTEREDKTYGTRIYQSRGLRDTEPYTEQGTTGAADEIRTYAQDLAQKELQGEVRYDANVRGTSGTLPKGTEESTGRDGQNRAADEKTGRSDRAAEDAGPAEMDTNDEQHPEQGGGNSEGYSDLHFIENEIVPESGTDEDEYVPESGTGLYFMPELPTEDEQRIKVEKYGYLNPRKADYIPHDYIRQVMLRGTGFEGVVGQNKYGVYESAYLW